MAHGRTGKKRPARSPVRATPRALVRKPRKVAYEKSFKLSKPFKAVIDKVLDRRQANQYKDTEIRRFQIPSTTQSGSDLHIWLPNIAQVGDEQNIGQDNISYTSGARTGKSLRLKTSYADLCFTIPCDDLESEEDRGCITVVVFLLSSKQFPGRQGRPGQLGFRRGASESPHGQWRLR